MITKANELRKLRDEYADEHEFIQAFEAFYKALKKKQKKTGLQNALYNLAKHLWKDEIKVYRQQKINLRKAEQEYRYLQDINIDEVKHLYMDRNINIELAKEKNGGKVLLLKRLLEAKANQPTLAPKRWVKSERKNIFESLPVPYHDLEPSTQRYVRKQVAYVEELAQYIVS